LEGVDEYVIGMGDAGCHGVRQVGDGREGEEVGEKAWPEWDAEEDRIGNWVLPTLKTEC